MEISDVHAIIKPEDYNLDTWLSVEDFELSDLLYQKRGVFSWLKHDCFRVVGSVMEVKIQGCDPRSLRQYNYTDEANPYSIYSVLWILY